jgi:hypothetical protein
MVLRIALASESDRQTIYALRHDVYARELAQHAANAEHELRDALDDGNVYIVAKSGEEIAGFISITPPALGTYSIDKYFRRDEIPFAIDRETFEIRILTVPASHRGTMAATLLMYASLRWVEAHGGTRIVALGRREVREMYVKAGLSPNLSCAQTRDQWRHSDDRFVHDCASNDPASARGINCTVQAGAVEFSLMTATPSAIRDRMSTRLLERIERPAEWDLTIPFHKPAECFHGGAFFDAIGDEFDQLHRSASIINADVLDAWFPPSPRVVAALEEHLPWLMRTSPPAACEGWCERSRASAASTRSASSPAPDRRASSTSRCASGSMRRRACSFPIRRTASTRMCWRRSFAAASNGSCCPRRINIASISTGCLEDGVAPLDMTSSSW